MPKRTDRICIVTPEFPGAMRCGGLGTAVYWHARALARAGVAVDVLLSGDVEIDTPAVWQRRFKDEIGVTLIEAGDWIRRHRPDLATVKFGPAFPGVQRTQWVLAYLRAHDYPVVYLQDYLGHGMAALQAKAAGLDFEDTQFALTLHGPTRWALDGLELFPHSPETFVIDHQEKTSVSMAGRVFAPSRYLREWVKTNWHLERRDVEVLPYCFATPENGPRRMVHGPFRHLVFFGRLETRKGLELFVEALNSSAQLQKEVRRVTFLGKNGQASGGSGRELIEAAFRKIKVDFEILDNKDTFQAWNWIEQQRDVLVVAPSLADNLPYAVIELFQRRVPFVTTLAGGIPEIVGDNPMALCKPTMPALRERLEEIVRSERLEIRYDTGYDARAAEKATITAHRGLVAASRKPAPRRASKPRTAKASARRAPEVSVIVTHYNYGGYLPFALQSLAAQECDFPFEVLVVDDASTRADHREAFLAQARLYAQDKRFKFFAEKTNRGAGGARNFAAEHARGKYLVFFDADNEARPDLLAVYRRAIEASGCDAMTCYVELVGQDDYANPRPIDSDRTDFVFAPPGPAVEAGYLLNVFGDTCAIHKRRTFLSLGGFSTNSPWYRRLPSGDWDWEFFAKLTLSGHKLGVVPRMLFRYRFSPDNQQSYNLRWKYRVRSIIRARYNSPEARQRVDWEWLMGLFEAQRATPGTQQGATAASSPYDYLAALPDDQLKALIGKSAGSANDATMRQMRARLLPLVSAWKSRRARVFLYGAGLHTRVLLGVVPELAQFVAGVIDRNPPHTFLGWRAIKPDEFRAEEADVVVYSSKEFEHAMYAAFSHHPVEHVLIYDGERKSKPLALAR